MSLKISLITAVFNRERTVGDTIDSVMKQTHDDVEYIVIDGNSTDDTSRIIASKSDGIDISLREADSGIYDALNKGIGLASGDVIGFLHADDLFASDRSLEYVQEGFKSNCVDAVYGDLVYVDQDQPDKVMRYWRSGGFSRPRFRRGWMPPHPTVYVRTEAYKKWGNYRTDVGSAADYEYLLRLMYRNQASVGYVPEVLVKMRAGGESNQSWTNRMRANKADQMAWSLNGLRPPLGLRFTKPLSKLPQYFHRPRT